MQLNANLAIQFKQFRDVATVAANSQILREQTNWIKRETTRQGYEKYKTLTSFGFAQPRTDGGSSSIDQRYELYELQITPNVKSIRTVIDDLAMRTDQYGEYKRTGSLLGESIAATEVRDITNTLNNGFTSGYNGADGVILFSSSHPNGGLATMSNVLSATALSEYAVSQLLTQARTTQDPRGLNYGAAAKYKLVVPPNLEWTAEKLLRSINVPGGNLNDKNVVGAALDGMIVQDYLTSTTAWFLVAPEKHSVIFLENMPAETTTDIDVEGHMNAVAKKSYGIGWSNGYFIYGCAGA